MTRLRWFYRFLAIVVCLAAVPAVHAQEPATPPEITTADPPAHISFVDGTALLERDGRSDAELRNMPLLAGDRVRTRAGRVEILYGDGSTLHLDTNTTVDFQSDELVRLIDGRVRVSIPGPRRTVGFRIDAPAGWAQIVEPGEYRVSLSPAGEIELAVLRGAAELANEIGRTPLRAGERAFARLNAAPSFAYVFNSASWDAFDRWSEERRDQRLGLSAQYLPDEVRAYSASFDRYGAWRHEPTYGYVWYPRVVAGWRPYYYGRWATFRPWGWTWIGTDPWAWPTHHYGRWGFSAGVWFWIPGRRWAPAWVSWAYAPGYVSWCPLGWNNRPVVQIVNVYRGYDPWHAWTVLPRRHFGADYVHVRARSAGIIDARTRSSFVVRNTAPEITGYAVPRAAAPIRAAGTAVPRGTRPNPVYTNLENSRMSPGAPRVIVGEDRRRSTAGDRVAGTGARASDVGAARPRNATPGTRSSAPNVAGSPGGDPYARPGLRAVPRNAPDAYRNAGSSPSRVQPSRRAPDDSSRVPGAVARERNAPAVTPSAPAYGNRPPAYDNRTAPRSEPRAAPGYDARDAYRPDYRRPPAGAPPSGGARAVPRGDYSAPPRPAGGGYERRAPSESRPSAPPAQAAPPQRSAPPPRASQPGSRSRGDARPSGGAVRRRGGN